MEKKKLEKIIVAVLLPAFIISFLYIRLRGRGAPARDYQSAGAEAEFKEDEHIDLIPKPAGALDIKYEASARDPLKDLFQAALYEIQKQGVKKEVKKQAMPLPKLSIAGLIWNTDMPQAIINGKIIKKGDAVEGVKVIGIERDGITVIHEGEAVFVPKKTK